MGLSRSDALYVRGALSMRLVSSSSPLGYWEHVGFVAPGRVAFALLSFVKYGATRATSSAVLRSMSGLVQPVWLRCTVCGALLL